MKPLSYFKNPIERLIIRHILKALYIICCSQKDKDDFYKFQLDIYGEITDYKIDWDLLFELTDFVYSLSFNTLVLTNIEKKIVYLSLFYIDLPQIGMLIGYSYNSIRRMQTDIRKKMNVPKEKSLSLFLHENYNVNLKIY